ncbi:MAG: hypothetical protein ACK5L0_04160 [Candidatus Fimivivens sp.]
MKKLLLWIAVVGAAALATKKFLLNQDKKDIEIVTEVASDEDFEAPVETSAPSPITTDASPEMQEEVPPQTLIDTEIG